jgi:hypothetical protein
LALMYKFDSVGMGHIDQVQNQTFFKNGLTSYYLTIETFLAANFLFS